MANATDGRVSVDVSTNKTLVAADSGIVQNVVADGITITLPSTALGLEYIVRNGGAKVNSGGPAGAVSDGSVLVTVAPAAADGFTGNGFTAAVNKAALNTKATSNVGDEIRFSGTGTAGVTGWVLGAVKGIWARQP
jgi:hypothetical protein